MENIFGVVLFETEGQVVCLGGEGVEGCEEEEADGHSGGDVVERFTLGLQPLEAQVRLLGL